jgi:glycosyltransferase involved in cell wall biosynthesis
MSSESPLVGVVVPAYNAARFLPFTIDSILAQTYAHWYAVIVDDGSTDATADIARQACDGDSRFCLLQQSNAGLRMARNAGFRLLPDDARLVVFLDSDDVWEPEALEILIDVLAATPEAPAAFGYCRLINEQGELILPGHGERDFFNRRMINDAGVMTHLPSHELASFECFLAGNFIKTPGSVLIRREPFEKIGLFQPMRSMPHSGCEDWEAWIRLSLFAPFRTVDRCVLNYRWHNQQMTRKLWIMGHGVYFTFRDLIVGSVEMSETRRRLVRTVLDKWLREIQRNSVLALTNRSRNAYRRACRMLASGRAREALNHYRAARQYGRRRDIAASAVIEPTPRLLDKIMAPEMLRPSEREDLSVDTPAAS